MCSLVSRLPLVLYRSAGEATTRRPLQPSTRSRCPRKRRTAEHPRRRMLCSRARTRQFAAWRGTQRWRWTTSHDNVTRQRQHRRQHRRQQGQEETVAAVTAAQHTHTHTHGEAGRRPTAAAYAPLCKLVLVILFITGTEEEERRRAWGGLERRIGGRASARIRVCSGRVNPRQRVGMCVLKVKGNADYIYLNVNYSN